MPGPGAADESGATELPLIPQVPLLPQRWVLHPGCSFMYFWSNFHAYKNVIKKYIYIKVYIPFYLCAFLHLRGGREEGLLLAC